MLFVSLYGPLLASSWVKFALSKSLGGWQTSPFGSTCSSCSSQWALHRILLHCTRRILLRQVTASNPALVKPNAAGEFPPVQHSIGLPDQANFGASINGLMNAVYAYSGTQIFLDFMSEMTHPRDFLKAMWSSQFFIYAWYMIYGFYMYKYQGQYVQNPSYLGISPYNWSTAGNALAMITALIAAALYGNLGLKGNILTLIARL